MKRVIQSAAFFGIFCLLAAAVNFVFCTKPNSFYREEKNSFDALFFGTSMMYCSVNPVLLWHEYGISSYNLAVQQQSTPLSYHYMVEALKTQKPKVFVYEVLGLGYAYEYADELAKGISASSLDCLKFSNNKIKAIQCSLPEEEWLAYKIPFLRQHTNYQSLRKDNFQYADNPYKGYHSSFESAGGTPVALFEQTKPTDARTAIFQKNREYLEKMTDFCRKHQIALVLYKSPTASAWKYSQALSNSIKDFAGQRGIPFLECNDIYQQLGIDFERDTLDNSHLNSLGAEKVTRYLGSYLSHQYRLPDHRGEAKYAFWNKSEEQYLQERKSYYLKQETDLSRYLDLLEDSHYLVFLSVKDEASHHLTDQIQEKLHWVLGTQDTLQGKNRWSYLAISDGGSLLAESLQETPVEWFGYFDHKRIQVISKGYQVGNLSSVQLDGKEYSPNSRGINLVVYDKTLGQVIDSVCFDTYADGSAYRK